MLAYSGTHILECQDFPLLPSPLPAYAAALPYLAVSKLRTITKSDNFGSTMAYSPGLGILRVWKSPHRYPWRTGSAAALQLRCSGLVFMLGTLSRPEPRRYSCFYLWTPPSTQYSACHREWYETTCSRLSPSSCGVMQVSSPQLSTTFDLVSQPQLE